VIRVLEIGKIGEEIAEDFLVSKGYSILERRFRSTRWGEVDLIALDKGVLVFVEVKTRTSEYYGIPSEAITGYKKAALKRTANYYCKVNKSAPESLRMDVISVIMARDSKSAKSITHYENAF